MEYTIKIGNAVPVFSKAEFPRLVAQWKVEDEESKDAPCPPGDEFLKQSNRRAHSYFAWRDLMQKAGLWSLFLHPYKGLIVNRPGCVGIEPADAASVRAALIRYRKTATLPAGKGIDHDYDLARLEWLDFWVHWAIATCETPAIENS